MLSEEKHPGACGRFIYVSCKQSFDSIPDACGKPAAHYEADQQLLAGNLSVYPADSGDSGPDPTDPDPDSFSVQSQDFLQERLYCGRYALHSDHCSPKP